MKTYIAVRPGFVSQAQAAFGTDMEIVVDDTLNEDYTFRQREEGLADFLEAQLEDEEAAAAKKADPKNAHTFLLPLVRPDEILDEEYQHATYLVVRIDRQDDPYDAAKKIASVKTIYYDADQINVKATITSLHNQLKNEGFKVHSISVANGLVGV
jgi:hypothetical protein